MEVAAAAGGGCGLQIGSVGDQAEALARYTERVAVDIDLETGHRDQRHSAREQRTQRPPLRAAGLVTDPRGSARRRETSHRTASLP